METNRTQKLEERNQMNYSTKIELIHKTKQELICARNRRNELKSKNTINKESSLYKHTIDYYNKLINLQLEHLHLLLRN